MKCPNGHEVNSQVKFCPICGADLRGTQFCTNCGGERNGDEEICPHCGKPYFIQRQNTVDSEGNSNKKLIVSLIIACVVLIALGSWFYNSKEKNVTSDTIDTIEQTNQTSQQEIEAIDTVSPFNEPLPSSSTLSESTSQDHSSSNNSNYSTSSSYSSEPTSKTFANEQYVTMYLANQTFTNYSGVDIRIDGSLRIYIDGDYAGVVSVLRYSSTSAMLRYGGGSYGEGKIGVSIENDRLRLNDPIDGTIWYQK